MSATATETGDPTPARGFMGSDRPARVAPATHPELACVRNDIRRAHRGRRALIQLRIAQDAGADDRAYIPADTYDAIPHHFPPPSDCITCAFAPNPIPSNHADRDRRAASSGRQWVYRRQHGITLRFLRRGVRVQDR